MTTATAEQIAHEAWEATKNFPAYDAEDRFLHLLEHIRDKGTLDDMEAEVIRECRKKVGLA
jgi:hypothetical protein